MNEIALKHCQSNLYRLLFQSFNYTLFKSDFFFLPKISHMTFTILNINQCTQNVAAGILRVKQRGQRSVIAWKALSQLILVISWLISVFFFLNDCAILSVCSPVLIQRPRFVFSNPVYDRKCGITSLVSYQEPLTTYVVTKQNPRGSY